MGFWDEDEDDETVERHRGNPEGFERAMREQGKHQGRSGCSLTLAAVPVAVGFLLRAKARR